jgi:hypothetical protein
MVKLVYSPLPGNRLNLITVIKLLNENYFKGFHFPFKYFISNHLDFYSIFLLSWMHTSESIVLETDEKVRTETYQGNFKKNITRNS